MVNKIIFWIVYQLVVAEYLFPYLRVYYSLTILNERPSFILPAILAAFIGVTFLLFTKLKTLKQFVIFTFVYLLIPNVVYFSNAGQGYLYAAIIMSSITTFSLALAWNRTIHNKPALNPVVLLAVLPLTALVLTHLNSLPMFTWLGNSLTRTIRINIFRLDYEGFMFHIAYKVVSALIIISVTLFPINSFTRKNAARLALR